MNLSETMHAVGVYAKSYFSSQNVCTYNVYTVHARSVYFAYFRSYMRVCYEIQELKGGIYRCKIRFILASLKPTKKKNLFKIFRNVNILHS